MSLSSQSPIRLEPAPGLTLLCLPDSRFKRAQLEVHFDNEIDDGQSPARTLLARLLEQGSFSYPNQMEITRAEEMLYGANVRIDSDRLAEHHRFSLGMSWVGSPFLPDGGSIDKGVLGLAHDLMTNPCVDQDGSCFPVATYKREQQQLSRRIESLQDDRATWARERFLNLMCSDEAYGVAPWGTVEEVQSLSRGDCEIAHRQLLETSPITAVAVGPIDPDSLAEWLLQFEGKEKRPLAMTSTRSAPNELREVQEQMEIDQARFLMGYRFTPPQDVFQMEALSLTSSLLGGGTHSRLFKIVREELSLCYGISSSLRVAKGILTIGAGIDASTYQQVRDQVRIQIDKLANGDFGDEELQLTKVNLLNDLEALGDTAPGLAGFITREQHLGFSRSPKDRADLIAQITKSDIMNVASQFAPDLAYMLAGEVQS